MIRCKIWDVLEGKPLFIDVLKPGYYTESVHLAEMVSLLGPPPQQLLDRGRAASKFFGPDGKKPRKLFNAATDGPPGCVTWDSDVTGHNGKLEGTVTSISDADRKAQFLAFARRMITWLPEERATAVELLQDPWLDEVR